MYCGDADVCLLRASDACSPPWGRPVTPTSLSTLSAPADFQAKSVLNSESNAHVFLNNVSIYNYFFMCSEPLSMKKLLDFSQQRLTGDCMGPRGRPGSPPAFRVVALPPEGVEPPLTPQVQGGAQTPEHVIPPDSQARSSRSLWRPLGRDLVLEPPPRGSETRAPRRWPSQGPRTALSTRPH